MVGSLNKIVSITPFAPIVLPNTSLHLCHYEDLANIVKESAKKNIEGIITAASEREVLFKDVLKILAKSKSRRIGLVSVPFSLTIAGMKLAEVLRLPIGVRSDSFVSLANINPDVDFTKTRKLKVKCRTFTEHTANQ